MTKEGLKQHIQSLIEAEYEKYGDYLPVEERDIFSKENRSLFIDSASSKLAESIYEEMKLREAFLKHKRK